MAPFSAQRALRLMLLATGAVVAVATLRAVTGGALAYPWELWAATGRVAALMAALALLISALRQTGRRVTAGWIGALALLFFAHFSYRLLTTGWHQTIPLTAGERAPLVEVDEGGEARLLHPALRFSIRDPGPAYHDASRTQLLAPPATATSQWYAYADDPPTAVLFVSVINDLGRSRAELAAAADRLQDELIAAGGGADLRVARRDVDWDGDRHAVHLHATTAAGIHLRLSVYAARRRRGPPYLVLLAVASTDPDALAAVLASFRPS